MTEEPQEVRLREVGQREGDFVESTVELAGGLARLGLGLLQLPLALLPRETRTHTLNAVRELSYAFARLPRDFADIAGEKIEEWARQENRTPFRSSLQAKLADPHFAQHLEIEVDQSVTTTADVPTAKVTTTPAAASTPPAASAPAPAASATTPPAAASTPPAASAPTSSPTPTRGRAVPPVAGNSGTLSAKKANAVPDSSKSTPVPVLSATQHETVARPVTGVLITHLEFNPPGKDLLGEYVLLRNDSDAPIDLTGCVLQDTSSHVYTFPSFTLAPGSEVRLWTQKGSDDATNLYWGSNSPIWNNTGDTATLLDSVGNTVATYTYSSSK